MKPTLILLLLSVTLRAATINVNPGGSIQNAINSAASGDTISVSSGTYNGDVNVNKSNLTVKGTGFPKIVGFVEMNASSCTFDGFACGNSSQPNARPWIKLNGDHNTASNCKLENVTNANVWDDAVAYQLSGNHDTFLKCITNHTSDMDSFRIFGDANSIIACEVYDKKNPNYGAGSHADSVQSWGGVTNGLVENCWFDQGSGQFGIINMDGGGNPSNSHDFTWRNNVIKGSDQLFLFLNNMRVYNNVFWRCGKVMGAIFWLDAGRYSGYEFKNNAFVDCGTNAGNGFIDGGLPWQVTCTNNYFSYGSNNGAVTYSTGTAAVNGGDPRFVSAGTDFHTQAGSVLSGKGATLNPAFLDRDGNQRTVPWDIGVYQGNAKPPEPSTKFRVGDRVTTTNLVNVRSTPGGALAGTQSANSTATVTASPATPAQFEGSVVQWWNLNFTNAPDGWVGEDNLDSSTATPTPTPTPTPSPSPAPSPSPTPPGTGSYSNWLNQLGKWIEQHPAKPD